jgi:hypothetical protein
VIASSSILATGLSLAAGVQPRPLAPHKFQLGLLLFTTAAAALSPDPVPRGGPARARIRWRLSQEPSARVQGPSAQGGKHSVGSSSPARRSTATHQTSFPAFLQSTIPSFPSVEARRPEGPPGPADGLRAHYSRARKRARKEAGELRKRLLLDPTFGDLYAEDDDMSVGLADPGMPTPQDMNSLNGLDEPLLANLEAFEERVRGGGRSRLGGARGGEAEIEDEQVTRMRKRKEVLGYRHAQEAQGRAARASPQKRLEQEGEPAARTWGGPHGQQGRAYDLLVVHHEGEGEGGPDCGSGHGLALEGSNGHVGPEKGGGAAEGGSPGLGERLGMPGWGEGGAGLLGEQGLENGLAVGQGEAGGGGIEHDMFHEMFSVLTGEEGGTRALPSGSTGRLADYRTGAGERQKRERYSYILPVPRHPKAHCGAPRLALSVPSVPPLLHVFAGGMGDDDAEAQDGEVEQAGREAVLPEETGGPSAPAMDSFEAPIAREGEEGQAAQESGPAGLQGDRASASLHSGGEAASATLLEEGPGRRLGLPLLEVPSGSGEGPGPELSFGLSDSAGPEKDGGAHASTADRQAPRSRQRESRLGDNRAERHAAETAEGERTGDGGKEEAATSRGEGQPASGQAGGEHAGPAVHAHPGTRAENGSAADAGPVPLPGDFRLAPPAKSSSPWSTPRLGPQAAPPEADLLHDLESLTPWSPSGKKPVPSPLFTFGRGSGPSPTFTPLPGADATAELDFLPLPSAALPALPGGLAGRHLAAGGEAHRPSSSPALAPYPRAPFPRLAEQLQLMEEDTRSEPGDIGRFRHRQRGRAASVERGGAERPLGAERGRGQQAEGGVRGQGPGEETGTGEEPGGGGERDDGEGSWNSEEEPVSPCKCSGARSHVAARGVTGKSSSGGRARADHAT